VLRLCGSDLAIAPTTRIKDLLLNHPEALRVLVYRRVPVTTADGSIAEAARASGLSPSALLEEIQAAVERRLAADGLRAAGRRSR
jgi:hypothetical protein